MNNSAIPKNPDSPQSIVPVLVPSATKRAEHLVYPMAVFTVIKKLGPGVITATPQMIATLSNIIENFIIFLNEVKV